jgi:hypothetical protein
MDIIGFLFGSGMLILWYFSNKNWIISDIVYTMILLAIVKFLKFGSLKMAFITFWLTALLNIVFILITQFYLKMYYNNLILYIFNDPLFILTPCISFTPN